MEQTLLPAIGLPMDDNKRIERLPQLLSVSALEQVFQLKRTATRKVIDRPDFPPPIELGGRHRLWVTAEVLAWVDRQPRVHARTMPKSLATVRRYRDGRLIACAGEQAT